MNAKENHMFCYKRKRELFTALYKGKSISNDTSVNINQIIHSKSIFT